MQIPATNVSCMQVYCFTNPGTLSDRLGDVLHALRGTFKAAIPPHDKRLPAGMDFLAGKLATITHSFVARGERGPGVGGGLRDMHAILNLDRGQTSQMSRFYENYWDGSLHLQLA